MKIIDFEKKQLSLFDFDEIYEIEKEHRRLNLIDVILHNAIWKNRQEMKKLSIKSRQILKERGII